MIDQLLGRPSPNLRRSQVFIVLFFCIWRLYKGDGAPRPFPSRTESALAPGPSGRGGQKVRDRAGKSWIWRLWIQLVGKRAVMWMSKLNERLKRFTPYQLILATLTLVYALRHFDDLLGISAPEPLARMYTRSYYRATYVNTAFDAGFSIAMNIRPKWLKDICSMLFSAYYLAYASEGDEVLRRFRAVCSVEMLRTTWEKTKNPYIRLITSSHRVRLPIVRTVTIARPSNSSRSSLPPVKAMLFFPGSEEELASATELIVDFPGGGFIAMGPECHEERLRIWAKRTGKPVLGVDYGKAPEYPYPWAIEEGFDAYRTLMETKGEVIGITSGKLAIVLTGDSAGGNICATIMLRILEHPTGIPKPVSMILAYPALDFNFTSWMSPQNLRVLRTEQSETQIPGLVHGKDHMRHKAPLSVVDDLDDRSRKGGGSKQKSWAKTLSGKLPGVSPKKEDGVKSYPQSPAASGWKSLPRSMSARLTGWIGKEEENTHEEDDEEEIQKVGRDQRRDAEKSLAERVKTPREERRFEFTRLDSPAPLEGKEEQDLQVNEMVETKSKKVPIGTRLTMTSRVGYFQDRIISPSMMRAMAILYIGPARNPDFETDYYISPILAPPHLLAHFPPVYFISGERDPFVDDTVIFSGKIREAKRARKVQAETVALSNSFKHGETLRMSSGKRGGKYIAAKMDTPDPILSELDDDWVQMRIIEGWGHGFMQMSSLMREVDPVLMEMADWIDESFEKAKEKQRDLEKLQAARMAIPTSPLSEDGSRTPVETTLLNNGIPAHSVHIKPSREYGQATPGQAFKRSDLGTAFAGDAEVDDGKDNMVTFTPKTKKRIPPPSNFHTVPRRPSKESLALQRSPSAPKFDADETGSSGEAMTIQTPPLVNSAKRFLSVQGTPKGSGAFALFGPGKSAPSSKPRSGRISPTLFGIPRISPSPAGTNSVPVTESSTNKITRPPLSGAASAPDKPKKGLVAAAVASARAASPALAAAGFAPQSVGNVSEAELLRRRRMEAVYGIGETKDGTGNEVDE
ncbi:hormone-sensitive lipase [Cryptococcus neoformans C23]|uniref:Hormone-sensitive lipase n=2 Tax=Cryptococcus neoformans TaxID=5207 RepID=A0A854QJL2_CRYNE|nr:hormone-sensitive lipase [Cryptococcus neoformans var. grubii H99]AUB22709.1 hormone-sensitive lipase [Cryptococcus neoformans var. grubii]OWZ35424.1 hormone-sensitive lipase [Cryptococcus neoformans var. grubii AD2-60a]OWZ47303.1 hormone-sensitive lipase [Cryptococcus neoformans var. grubii C23]OWZ80191.1 hormone-sensitive lipase [Cryptococcus neoformans var. grubii Bt85]OXC86508.1 hormone-sensitive lipase [Cryptococcus neoformans var. grubii AD1-7a]OXG22176.1 hormone-sensitive lipase [Cr|eukprot:XP_012047185.1 hormone-sensitive lipase [Cryptococcus neoformans var. grubii H99]